MSGLRDLVGLYVQPGALVFDIGANVGKHTAWLLELGCRVVAVEPQPAMAERIAPHPNLTVMCLAVSDREGVADFYVSPGHEYVSTMAVEEGFLEKVQTHAAYLYDEPVRVVTTTLDRLIAIYGVPAFCKIDVEGHERAVLDGLTWALPALSFEVHDFDLPKADYCMARLGELGRYEYVYSPRESFVAQPWDPAAVDIFGDIYATLAR